MLGVKTVSQILWFLLYIICLISMTFKDEKKWIKHVLCINLLAYFLFTFFFLCINYKFKLKHFLISWGYCPTHKSARITKKRRKIVYSSHSRLSEENRKIKLQQKIEWQNNFTTRPNSLRHILKKFKLPQLVQALL